MLQYLCALVSHWESPKLRFLLFRLRVVFELEDVDLECLLVLAHLAQYDRAGLKEVRVC